VSGDGQPKVALLIFCAVRRESLYMQQLLLQVDRHLEAVLLFLHQLSATLERASPARL
jgi:hypothetical protein